MNTFSPDRTHQSRRVLCSLSLLLATLLLLTLTASGCGQKSGASLTAEQQRDKATATAINEATGLDVGPLLQAFASASPMVRYNLKEFTDSLRAKNGTEALKALNTLAADATLTPEQKQAVEQLLPQLKSWAAGHH
jgi:hypothetical protein